MLTEARFSTRNLQNPDDAEIAALLDRRYGDGLVYLMSDGDHTVLCRAMELGLVDEAGYLTRCGYRLARRWE